MHAALLGAAIVAAALSIGTASASAQTTSARSDSLEVSSRADELLADGKDDRAGPLYRRALEIDETNERAYIGLSAVLDARGEHAEALELLGRAESLLGWTVGLSVQRGIHLSRLQRWDEVVAALTETVERAPSSYEAAYYLAGGLMHRGDWTRAIAAFDRYLANRPAALANRDLEVAGRRAYAQIGAGQFDQARAALERILRTDPGRASARMLLFTALARSGQCESALEIVPSLESVRAAAPTLTYDVAVCQFRTGRARLALATLEDYSGGLAERHLLAARINVSLDRSDAARNAYVAAISAGLPATSEYAAWLAGRNEHRAVVDLLWPSYEQRSAPNELELLIESLARTGDFARAETVGSRLVELRPAPRSWLLRGRAALRLGHWEAADEDFSRVLQSEPKNRRAVRGASTALAHMATAAFRTGDRELAHRLLARAHQTDPMADDVAHNLALLELERNNPQRTIALLEGRVELSTNQYASAVLLGRAQLQLGNTDAAGRQFEKVVGARAAPAAVRSQALTSLAYVVARSSPDRAVKLIDSARKQGELGPASQAVLARAEAEARLALAERDYERGAFKQMKRDLEQVATDELDDEARVRLALLRLFEVGHDKGLAAALKQLDKVGDAQLAAVSKELPPATLRRALAAFLGLSFVANPSEYARYLRAQATALEKEPSMSTALTALYDKLLEMAVSRRSAALIGQLVSTAPTRLQSTSFRHNALIAAASIGRTTRPLTSAQIAALEKLAPDVPEALVNLAVDADRRGADANAVRYLRQIPTGRRTPAIREWLRWKELFHGAP